MPSPSDAEPLSPSGAEPPYLSSAGSIEPGRVPVRPLTWVLFLASLLVTGMGAMCDNQAIQVPLVRWLNDPSLYPGDPFVAALASYPSALWHFVAWPARLVPLEPLLLVLFLVERFLLLYAAGRLARALAPRTPLAEVWAMALFALGVNSLFGGGTIVESYFEHTGFVFPFLLLAAAAFHESRPWLWALCMGVVFNATPLYGIFATVTFAAVFVLDPDFRAGWRRWVRPSLLFLALCAYPVFLMLIVAQHGEVNESLWLLASRVRSWRHLYPRSWNPVHLVEGEALMAGFLVAIVLARRRIPRLFRHGVIWSVVACLSMATAYAVAYVVRWRQLLLLQPARATDLWVALASVGIAAIGSVWITERREGWARRIGVLMLGASLLLWRPPGSLAAAVCLAAIGLPPVWRWLFRQGDPRRLALLLSAWALVAGGLSLAERFSDRGSLAPALVTLPDPPVRAVSAWARANTPRDAVFLVNLGGDPDWDSFRALAERPVYTSWDDGTAILWSPSFVGEWTVRLRFVGFEITRRVMRPDHLLNDIFRDLGDEQVESARSHYKLDYWVVTSDHLSAFPVVFRTAGYKVLSVSAPDRAPLSTSG